MAKTRKRRAPRPRVVLVSPAPAPRRSAKSTPTTVVASVWQWADTAGNSAHGVFFLVTHLTSFVTAVAAIILGAHH